MSVVDDYVESIRDGDVERLRRVLATDHGLLAMTVSREVSGVDAGHGTGLHLAVLLGAAGIARELIEAGIDLDARNDEGRTALHDSIEYGRTAITELLLEQGAHVDVNAAAILGRLDRLRELLDADPGLANDRSTRLSPLGWAAFGNQVHTACELIERGARMDDHELLCAASVGHVEVGRLLIDRGADPDEIAPEAGGNALHAAASMRYTDDSTEFIRLLLERGADPTLRTTRGQTALELARLGEQRARRAEAAGDTRAAKNWSGAITLLRDADRG